MTFEEWWKEYSRISLGGYSFAEAAWNAAYREGMLRSEKISNDYATEQTGSNDMALGRYEGGIVIAGRIREEAEKGDKP